MSRRILRMHDIVRVLKALGFQLVRRSGSHLIFKHGTSGLLITLPETDDVRPVYIRNIERQVARFNIASEEKIHEMLYGR